MVWCVGKEERNLETKRSVQTWAIALIMFLMGACGIAYEYTLSKIASDILGNSAQQWAIVIAIMLFCMGLGAEIQQYIPDRRMVPMLAGSQILLALLGGYGSLWLIHVFSAAPSHFVLVKYVLVSSVGILVGFEIPLLTRINEQFSKDVKSNLARILKMDYLGALLGALLWVFVLLRNFTMIEAGLLLALTTLVSAWVLVRVFPEQLGGMQAWFTLSLVAGVLLIGLAWREGSEWAQSAEQRLYRDKIIFSKTTKYQHVVLTQSRQGEISCFINGHLQFNSADEYIYHEHLVHPAMQIAPRRERVLILGGGDGLALREVLKYGDVETVTLVDLDPEMTDLARENPHLVELNGGSLANPKVLSLRNIVQKDHASQKMTVENSRGIQTGQSGELPEVYLFNVDAARFLAQAPGRYDVIVIDFPDPNAPELANLYSQHFYGFLAKKLSADGIFVQQSTSPYHAKEAFLCIGRTMQSAGLSAVPYHDNVPSFGEWGWWIGGNANLYPEAKVKTLLQSVQELTNLTEYLTPELIKTSLHFGKNQLNTEETAINTITNPCIHRYYLKAWQSQ
jgi:spermidine synthase